MQSVNQSQRYEWVSDVGRTMKDLDEKQSRSAQMIDTRGWPVCVVSYWCINYIQESCPNMSHTICRFSSQQERAGLRLIIGLSPSISEIQAKTLKMGRLLQPSRWWRESRHGIELLNGLRQQQNACLEAYCFIGKEKKWAEFQATTTPWCVSLRAGNERQYQWRSHAQHVLEENGVGWSSISILCTRYRFIWYNSPDTTQHLPRKTIESKRDARKRQRWDVGRKYPRLSKRFPDGEWIKGCRTHHYVELVYEYSIA